MDFMEKLKNKNIIAAARNPDDITAALGRQIGVVFLLAGDIFDLIKIAGNTHEKKPLFLVHLDLIRGVARDQAGISYLKRSFGIDGVISTHSSVIGYAKKAGLITIQRLFIVDSESLKSGAKLVQNCKPDGVEILPGIILPYIKEELAKLNFPPIIGGGLIKTHYDVKKILDSGAIAISTSKKELW